ncbi:MAG: TDP-N-acetylfucosamine:lipid II N-acetylfucosaminyltransferase [Prevotella sp.]|jgi:hypothetical protein|nr:TDP-N-acetylfucosamine:lipid II N-acetylfucosaminyltransferase [Prevotella sp.]
MKNLHCCVDDKFIDGAISLFEADRNVQNIYVIIKNESNYQFHYIKSHKVEIIKEDSFLDFCKEFDVIYLHSLFCISPTLIQKIPHNKKVVWFSWGYDIYPDIIPIRLYDPLTKKYRHYNTGPRIFFYELRHKLKYWLYEKEIVWKALNRVDFYSGVFPYEYDLIRKKVSCFRAKRLDFYYGSINFFIPEKVDDVYFPQNRTSILIGNSAALTNNHLDIFEFINNSYLTNIDKIIVPLSYSGSRRYVNKVKIEGEKKFGTKFLPLMSYLPLQEYINLISNCRTAIFFHERQQASDNVFMQMIYGARVFMSKSSLMYQYLKKQGYKIYSLQDDYSLLNLPMSYDDVILNRKMLSENYASNRLLERVQNINKVLFKSL